MAEESGQEDPGEKKLEVDRRLINSRIAQLNRELKEVKKHREITRGQRSRKGIPVAAIVGYTNAGKSTLLNHLTGAGVLEEDKLFATLDPTTRLLKLPGINSCCLRIRIGFIRKLPHHLIDAFRSTLEEAKYADLILHVVDASNPQADKQMHIVYETLRKLEVNGKTVITLFNKQTVSCREESIRDGRADRTLKISAKTGEGLDRLKELLAEVMREGKSYIEILIPYAKSGLIETIHVQGELVSEEYLPEGTFIKAYVPGELYARLQKLL